MPRTEELLRKIPLLTFSAEEGPKHIAQAERAMVRGYIVKPFTEKTLEEKLRRMLRPLQ